MKKKSLPADWRTITIPGILLAAFGLTIASGCGNNDSVAGSLNPANDPKAFDHNRPQSADDKAKMEAYMKSHRTQGPQPGAAKGPGAQPSVIKL